MNEEKKDKAATSLSRRGFLKAGGTAMGAVVLGGLAGGVSAPAAAEGTKIKATSNIGQPHPYSAVSYEPIAGTDPILPVAVPAKWDYESDVVVVGTGGGGLNATVRCAEAGLSVIALDKIEGAGGASTKESSCFMCYGGTKVQNAIGFGYPAFPYDPEALAQMWLGQAPDIDIKLARKCAVKIPECNDWMGDHGIPWATTPAFASMQTMFLSWKDSVQPSDSANPTTTAFFPRAMKLVTDQMYQVAQTAGAKFYFKTQVVALVKDGDAIVGVKAVNINGEELYYHASKGVILTAGGFAANPQMLQKYCPTAYRGAASCKLPPADTGEVIRMGLGAGADLAGFDTWGAFDGGIDAYAEGLGPFSHYLYSGDNQLSRQPWLAIDKTGARQLYYPFVPDGYHTEAVYQQFGGLTLPKLQAARQGGRIYVIFDSDYETNIFKFKQIGCRVPITPDMPNIERLPEWLAPHDWRQGVAKALASGAIKQADTIAGLADLLGLNQDLLANAVTNWNKVCAAGVDPDYGYEPNWLVPIAKGPFYGIRIGAQMGQTLCGLHINEDFQAINTDGLPIKGLYSGAHTSGGTEAFLFGNYGTWTGGYCAAEGLLKSLGKS